MSTLTAPPFPHVARSRPVLQPIELPSAGTAPVVPTPDAILQLGLAFWGSKTLLSAIELGVFTTLAQGPGTAEELERRLGLHPRASRDFLDALVALGMLQRMGRVYANTPAADHFLDRAKPSYVGGMLEMANSRLYRFWGSLTEALRTGQPQNEVRQGEQPLFQALYADPARLEEFLGAMTGISHAANREIAASFPWSKYRTFLDVGTAQGDLAVQVARAHPHLTGTGFDLPAVGPAFGAYTKRAGVADRVRFAPGDFFAMPLPKADVVMMGHVLHDWNLEQKKHLLRAAYAALPVGGAVIVHESLIDDARRHNAFGLLMSLNMLIETPGGFDFTATDAIGWMKEAGFGEAYVQHLVGPDSMVVALK